MTINCRDEEQFMDTIHGLVVRGLTFKADRDSYTITLTGGY